MKAKSIALVVLGFFVLLFSNQPAYAKLWMKSYGGGEGDFGNSIQATPDGEYVVAGKTGSFGVNNGALWIVKLDRATAIGLQGD